MAFLGGINVGGHRVTMERLRAELEALGYDGVRTFIASGNVVFSSTARKTSGLETTIETHLADRLGYAVPTFVRRGPAVVEIAARGPFGTVRPPDSHFVGFLKQAPGASAVRAVAALSNHQDRFEIHGAELHWLIHGGMSDTSVKPAVLAGAVGGPFTIRNTTSLRKLAATL